MRNRALLVAILALAALLLIPLGLASAQSSRQEPIERFAEELGVSVEELQAAFRTVVGEQLDAAVSDGRLTREQADRIAERVDERGLDALFGLGRPGGRHGGWGRFRGAEVTGADAERASEAALAEVGDGEVAHVFAPRRGDAAYGVIVRADGAKILVLLDEDFEVTDVHRWDRRGPSREAA